MSGRKIYSIKWDVKFGFAYLHLEMFRQDYPVVGFSQRSSWDRLWERMQWKIRLAVLAIFIGGVFLGSAWQRRVDEETYTQPRIERIRAGTGTLTNPLLLCSLESEAGSEMYGKLKNNLETVIDTAKQGGQLNSGAVYFRDFNEGVYFTINGEERFLPASLNKVPLMIKVLERAEADPDFLDRRIVNHSPEDANVAQVVRPSASMRSFASYSLAEALELMIVHSDNNAYNAITGVIDYATYANLFEMLKLPTEYETGLTVSEYVYFLRVLYSATYLSQEMSERALQLLAKTEYANGLRAGVPKEVVVAHKFGTVGVPTDGLLGESVERQLHDCGVVYAPDKPYLLCVMTKSKAKLSEIEAFVADVSKKVYDEVISR